MMFCVCFVFKKICTFCSARSLLSWSHCDAQDRRRGLALRADVPHIGGHALLKQIKGKSKPPLISLNVQALFKATCWVSHLQGCCLHRHSNYTLNALAITKHGCTFKIQPIASQADVRIVICIHNLWNIICHNTCITSAVFSCARSCPTLQKMSYLT